MTIRRGATLIELLVVMTSCATFLSLSGQLLHRALKAQSESRRFFDAERTAWRLAHDFRRDVHAADAATTGDAVDEDVLLRLELPDGGMVDYRCEGARVVRLLKRPDEQPSRETYGLPPGAAVSVEVEDATRLVTLLIEAEKPAPGALPPTSVNNARLRLESVALAGRNAQWKPQEGDP
jgi:hypothetical protein